MNNFQSHSSLPLPPTEGSTPPSTERGRLASNAGVMNRKCAYCDRRFSKAEHLKRHQRSHTGEKPFRCDVCLKSYARSDVLIRHTRNHHSDSTESTGEKLQALKSPKSETSGGLEEAPRSVSGTILPQMSSISALPMQTHSNLQHMLTQPTSTFSTDHQIAMTHQIPVQASLQSQSLHRMSSQHDGSCLIEAAIQAAGPSQTPAYSVVDQKPSQYHMQQPVQSGRQPRNYPQQAVQDQNIYPSYSQPYPDLSHWLEACDIDMQPLPYGLDIWGDSAMMNFMGVDSGPPALISRAKKQRPSFTRDVPDERFERVERLWPLRRGTTQSRLGQTLWDQVIAHDQDSLFSESGPDEQHQGNVHVRRNGSSRWGLGEDCRARLVRDYINPRRSQATSDTDIAVDKSYRGDEASLDSKFPSAEVLDMSLDLFFKRFHAILPFAHRATFVAATTATSLLLPMCLIGLEVLDYEGSRKFIKAYLPDAVEKVRNELTARALPSCQSSQLLTTLASSILLLRIAATNPVPGLDEQVHCLYSEAISLAQRRGLFAAFNGPQISLELLHQGRDDDATWKAWSRVEAAKRVIICLIMCDSFWANISDTIPIIRIDNLSFSIPCSTELFEAPNARKWAQVASSGTSKIITQVTGVNIDTNSLPALDTELAIQGFLAGLWLRLVEARHRLLLPFRHHDANSTTQRPLIPLPIYALDPTAASIVPLLTSIPLVYHPLIQNSNPNILAWWHSQCMCLLADLPLFELAAGREGPDRAKLALESISIWAQTPAARRACVHAAQTFAVMSGRRISDGTTSHSEIALFHGALVLGLYLFTVHDEDAPADPPHAAAQQLEDEDELFELLDLVDWRSIGAEGMTVETANPTAANNSSTVVANGLIQSPTPLTGLESAAKRFIIKGGTVSFNGAMHRGGYNSSRRILLDYANLMKSVAKWNVRGYCRILRIMSDTLIEVDDGSGSE